MNPQTLNRFGYVLNNPIRFNDPTGHRCADGDEDIWGYCDYRPPQQPSGNEEGGGDDDCDLQCELDEFEGIETVEEDDMETVTLFGQSQKVSPAEYVLLLNENGEIDRWKLLRLGSIFLHALNQTRRLFPGESQLNSPADAFRHAYWNALITREFGSEFAEAFTTGHETGYGQIREEQFMDLHNNEVGRNIGSTYSDVPIPILQQKILEALENGDLYVWTGQEIYLSNECPLC